MEIQESDENGFTALLSNATISQERDSVNLVNNEGLNTLSLDRTVQLTDGSTAQIDYEVEGNQIIASYDRKIERDDIAPAPQLRSVAGCASSALLAVGAVAGGVAGILSAPVTGPVGPLATVAATTGIAGSVGMVATECSG